MSPVAFLCGGCKRPLWTPEGIRGSVAACAVCGASNQVPADAPALGEASLAAPAGEDATAGLVNLATLPIIANQTENALENKPIGLISPQIPSKLTASTAKAFPWLLLWMTLSFSALSAILSIYLVLRLRAADEALRKRAISNADPTLEIVEQKRRRINDLAIG